MIRLVATDGELTVVRRLAGHAYGRWEVDWPDSVPEDQRPVLDDDRAHGYVHRLGSGAGRMGRRFVRADVGVTAAEYDESGVVAGSGFSDVEATLDAAVSQTDEEAVLERSIGREGLGGWRPGTDFVVGDVVEVLVWGRVVSLPVTGIESVSEGGVVVDWRVTVGGQLVGDDGERRRANAELERAVWLERRERLADVGRASRAAARAQSTADSAQSAADGAQSTADAVGREAQELREALSGGGASSRDVRQQLEELNRQLQERGESAPDGLIPAYIAANTMRWRMQDYTNELLAWQVQTLQESAAWTQKYAPYVVKNGSSDNFLHTSDTGGIYMENVSSDVHLDLTIVYGFNVPLVGVSFYVRTFSLDPGESATQRTNSFGADGGDGFIYVHPVPLRPFEPSPPPAMPRN